MARNKKKKHNFCSLLFMAIFLEGVSEAMRYWWLTLGLNECHSDSRKGFKVRCDLGSGHEGENT